MRLEKFKNTLIPIDLVFYATYEKGGKWDKGKTNIYVIMPNSPFSKTIEFDGNCLNKFLKWYESLKKDEVSVKYHANDFMFPEAPRIMLCKGEAEPFTIEQPWYKGQPICSTATSTSETSTTTILDVQNNKD